MKVDLDNSKVIEYLCEVTDQLVKERFGDSGYIEDEDGSRYTDEAQDFFNEKYDEQEELLGSILGIFPTQGSESILN